MTQWVACRRATLLIPSGPSTDPDKKHLHVVLNDPIDVGRGPEVLIVSVCSISPSLGYDTSCTFFPGEHDFIKKHSYVAYRFCKLVDPNVLEQRVASGIFIPKALLDKKLFLYVIEGITTSPHAAPRYKKFIAAAGSQKT